MEDKPSNKSKVVLPLSLVNPATSQSSDTHSGDVSITTSRSSVTHSGDKDGRDHRENVHMPSKNNNPYNFVVGSAVQLMNMGQYGIIKWIGTIQDTKMLYAGVELVRCKIIIIVKLLYEGDCKQWHSCMGVKLIGRAQSATADCFNRIFECSCPLMNQHKLNYMQKKVQTSSDLAVCSLGKYSYQRGHASKPADCFNKIIDCSIRVYWHSQLLGGPGPYQAYPWLYP